MPDFKSAPIFISLAFALLTGCSAEPIAPTVVAPRNSSANATPAATATNPTVIEIFQSQGCSSCPPANANVNAVADRPDILALSFAVTYWDRLGWKDRFAKPAFTKRQWAYAHSARRGSVYTPQVIINGGKAIVGSNRNEFDKVIAAAGRPIGGPAISTEDGSGKVTVGPGQIGSTVWLVRYDPTNRAVSIRAGENGGRTLPHRHIVTQLVELGQTAKTAKTYDLPRSVDINLESAILVQEGKGGLITAARRI
jgi:hypothetical protein